MVRYPVILALYVDEILVLSNNSQMMSQGKRSLSKRFEMSDQGPVHFILGMLIKRPKEQNIVH